MISASRLPTKGGKWFGGIFMNALHTILTIIQVILAVGLVVIVTIQSGKSAGLSGAIAGGSGDTYLGKNKNKGLDAKLALATKCRDDAGREVLLAPGKTWIALFPANAALIF